MHLPSLIAKFSRSLEPHNRLTSGETKVGLGLTGPSHIPVQVCVRAYYVKESREKCFLTQWFLIKY